MPLSYEEFLERLAIMVDPELLCDILDITSEDIIERFQDVIEYKMGVLREAYDVDTGEDYDV